MKICIYGAGAIGGHLAARLHKAGAEVSVVARGAHLDVVLGCASSGPALLRVQDPFARLTGTQKGGLTLRLGDLRAVAEQD
jgi:nucleoside-diphosphate-sugar epimerase